MVAAVTTNGKVAPAVPAGKGNPFAKKDAGPAKGKAPPFAKKGAAPVKKMAIDPKTLASMTKSLK